MNDKVKKTILVTGASSCFGLLIAQKLQASGYIVIGTARNPNKIQHPLPFKLLALDITDDQSINNFTIELFKSVNQLDILINNAGFYISGLAEETSVEQGKAQFETNFWGTVKLTTELLPYFRKQRFGKIITLSSIFGLIGFPNIAYYAASKHALEGFFKSLRFELNSFNIKVAMVEPMGFKTNIFNNSVVVSGKISDYDNYRAKIAAFTKDLVEKAPEPTPVIDVLMKVVADENPKFNHPVGKGGKLLLHLQHFYFKGLEKLVLKTFNKFKGK